MGVGSRLGFRPLARQLGLTEEDARDRLGDPDDSLHDRLGDERERQEQRQALAKKLQAAASARATKRVQRSRHGQLRAFADAAMARARGVRDQASSASAELTRLRTNSAARGFAKGAKEAIDFAKEAARDAKSAAHAARRAQQYGTGAAAVGASIRADAGAQVAESAANLVDAHVNLVRVAANPHADSYAQSVLVDRALAAVDLAQAQLGLLLAPENDPAALAALDEAVAATAQAKMAIDEAIASDPPLLGLEVTSWPGGCPGSAAVPVFPVSCIDACRKKCASPRAPKLRYVKSSEAANAGACAEAEAKKLGQDDDDSDDKKSVHAGGSGRRTVKPGATSDEHAGRKKKKKKPPPPPPPPVVAPDDGAGLGAEEQPAGPGAGAGGVAHLGGAAHPGAGGDRGRGRRPSKRSGAQRSLTQLRAQLRKKFRNKGDLEKAIDADRKAKLRQAQDLWRDVLSARGRSERWINSFLSRHQTSLLTLIDGEVARKRLEDAIANHPQPGTRRAARWQLDELELGLRITRFVMRSEAGIATPKEAVALVSEAQEVDDVIDSVRMNTGSRPKEAGLGDVLLALANPIIGLANLADDDTFGGNPARIWVSMVGGIEGIDELIEEAQVTLPTRRQRPVAEMSAQALSDASSRRFRRFLSAQLAKPYEGMSHGQFVATVVGQAVVGVIAGVVAGASVVALGGGFLAMAGVGAGGGAVSATADYLIRSLARAGGDVSEMRVDGEALLEEAAYGAMLGGVIDVGAGTIKPVLRGLGGGFRAVGRAVRPAVEQATDTVAGIARQTRTVATEAAERTVAGGRRVVTTVVEDVRQGLHTSSIGPSGGMRRGFGGQRGSVPVPGGRRAVSRAAGVQFPEAAGAETPGVMTPDDAVTVFRGTDFHTEKSVFRQTRRVMSDAALNAYVEGIEDGLGESAALARAQAASEAAHEAQLAFWGDLNDYVQAHGEFGQELTREVGPRSLISVTTERKVASGFGDTVFELRVPRDQLIQQTIPGSGESEFLIPHMSPSP